VPAAAAFSMSFTALPASVTPRIRKDVLVPRGDGWEIPAREKIQKSYAGLNLAQRLGVLDWLRLRETDGRAPRLRLCPAVRIFGAHQTGKLKCPE